MVAPIEFARKSNQSAHLLFVKYPCASSIAPPHMTGISQMITAFFLENELEDLKRSNDRVEANPKYIKKWATLSIFGNKGKLSEVSNVPKERYMIMSITNVEGRKRKIIAARFIKFRVICSVNRDKDNLF